MRHVGCASSSSSSLILLLGLALALARTTPLLHRRVTTSTTDVEKTKIRDRDAREKVSFLLNNRWATRLLSKTN
jgi:hypothetical protein